MENEINENQKIKNNKYNKTFINDLFMYTLSTEMNIFINFLLGIFFSFSSNGLFYLIIISLLLEIATYLFTNGVHPYWTIHERPLILIFYFVGWFFGRVLFVNTIIEGQSVFTVGAPQKDDFWM